MGKFDSEVQPGSLTLAPATELLMLPDLEVADRAGNAFHHGNDETFTSIAEGTIVNVVFIEHRREGKEDLEEVRAHACFKIPFCLKTRVVIEFGEETLHAEVFHVEDWLFDLAGLRLGLRSFVNVTDESHFFFFE